MDGNLIVQIAVGGAIALIVLGVLSMIVAGFRALAQGKQDFKRIGLMAVPFVVFGVSYAVLGSDVAKAGVMTTLVMMGIMVGSIVITGLRGTFKL